MNGKGKTARSHMIGIKDNKSLFTRLYQNKTPLGIAPLLDKGDSEIKDKR